MRIINENVPNLNRVEADVVMPYDLAVAKADCEKKEKEIEDRLKKADKLQQKESPNVREPKPANKNPQLKKLNLEESLFEDCECDEEGCECKEEEKVDEAYGEAGGKLWSDLEHAIKHDILQIALKHKEFPTEEEVCSIATSALARAQEEAGMNEGCIKEEICPICGDDVDEPCEKCKAEMKKKEPVKEDIDEAEWIDTLLQAEEISPEDAEIARNINWKINGEDIGLFIDQIKDHMDIKDIQKVGYCDPEGFDGGYVVFTNNGPVKFGWVDFETGLHPIQEEIIDEAKREPVTLFDRVMIELDKQMAEYSRGKAKRLLDRPNAERYDSEEGELFSALDDDGITVVADDLSFAQEVADAYDLDTKDTRLGGQPALTIIVPEDEDMEFPR